MLERENIISKLSQYKHDHKDKYGIEQIGIFGSFATNKATDQSDIDIFVVLQHASLFLLSRIRIDLEELLQIPVDLVQLRDRMNPYLKSHIEKEAINA